MTRDESGSRWGSRLLYFVADCRDQAGGHAAIRLCLVASVARSSLCAMICQPAGSEEAGSPARRHQSGGRLGRARRAAAVSASQPSSPPGTTAEAAAGNKSRSQYPVHSTSAKLTGAGRHTARSAWIKVIRSSSPRRLASRSSSSSATSEASTATTGHPAAPQAERRPTGRSPAQAPTQPAPNRPPPRPPPTAPAPRPGAARTRRRSPPGTWRSSEAGRGDRPDSDLGGS